MLNDKFEKISYFKDFSAFVQEAETDIRQRLITALQQENLLCDETVLGDLNTQPPQIDSPAHMLRYLAESGALAVEATNIDRACEEIEDGVTGLARARAGISSRWMENAKNFLQKNPAAWSKRPFLHLLRRCYNGVRWLIHLRYWPGANK